MPTQDKKSNYQFNIQKITENLFYIFIFLLPLQTRWIWHYGNLNGGQWEYGTFSLYGAEILLWVIFLATLFVYRKESSVGENGARLRSFGVGLRFLFIIYLLLSISWSPNKQLAAYYAFHVIEAAILIYLITKINFNYKKLLYTILASSFVQACLGIWQFINQQVVANKWLGIAGQDPSDLGVSVVFTGLRRWLRAYGSFSHPNVLAGFLAFGFLIGLYLIINHQVENKKQLYGKLVLIFANLIILVGLLFTFSRGAWVSLFIVLLIYCFIVWRQKGAKLPIGSLAPTIFRNLILFLTYSLLLTAVIVFIFKEPFLTRIKGTERLEKKSTEERLSYYQDGWQLIKKRPIFGVGIGNYTLAVHDLIDSNRKSWTYQPVHNVYVLVLAELGVAGFILFITLLLYYFIAIRKKPLLITIYLLLITIMLFDHYLWTSYFGVMLLGLVIGLMTKSKHLQIIK